MNQAQNACMARSVMDINWNNKYNGLEAYHLSARRPSVQSMSGSSLTSSPESMISDNSSRSSRASSISSASSLSSANAWAPTSVKLNRLATLRCAGLPCPMPSQQSTLQKEPETTYLGSYTMEPLVTEPMSSPDMDILKLSDSECMTALPIRARENPRPIQDRESPSKGRKRGRSSVDMSLHGNVREFLGPDARSYLADAASCVIPDRAVAQPSSFLRSPRSSDYAAKALQSPARSVLERRLPISRDLGRKRACCASEAGLMTFSGGPGMWEGVL